MVNPNTLSQVHKLVDKANQNQLDVVLELLQPSSSRYSAEEINSFYLRLKKFEDDGSKGFSVNESHELIRNKYKRDGL
jgi:hypothetical protein